MINNIKLYFKTIGVRSVWLAVKGKLTHRQFIISKRHKDIKHPIMMRVPSSDAYTYKQVFIDQEYLFNVTHVPKVIVDAGANIGLASIYFANKYPNAKIIAIEPERSNFELLLKNVEPYKNIIAMQGALWNKNEKIDLVDPGLGEWGFMTEGGASKNHLHSEKRHDIDAFTLDNILSLYDLDKIDILKIDIEGAEKEVFANTSSWINKVDSMIVELHERMKPGCNRSFYNGSNGFDNEWHLGENVYLSRANAISK